MSKLKKKLAGLLCAVMALSCCLVSASAFEAGDAGQYDIDGNLSCYVNAMGGIDFGAQVFKDVTVNVDESGNATATISLGTGTGTIYSVPHTDFVDPQVTPCYYDAAGEVQDAQYTISENTAQNASGENINYVDSMTIPVSQDTSEYYVWIYINSNVMGVQFGDGTGSGSSNQPGVATPYVGKLTLDWSTLTEIVTPDETTEQSATVNYTVDNSYVVSIPAEITVDPATKTAAYTVEAQDFALTAGAYVTVTADTEGTLSNGTDTLAFTNELASGQLNEDGQTLDGVITVTGEAASTGTYTGSLNFTVNYFSGN